MKDDNVIQIKSLSFAVKIVKVCQELVEGKKELLRIISSIQKTHLQKIRNILIANSKFVILHSKFVIHTYD